MSNFVCHFNEFKKSSYEIITKYATDPLEVIFEQWIWWIFDSLSFDFLVIFVVVNDRTNFSRIIKPIDISNDLKRSKSWIVTYLKDKKYSIELV